MLAYTLLIILVSFILGFAVNGAFLYLTALASAWLLILLAIATWLALVGKLDWFPLDCRRGRKR
jgi:hypothetical protein